MGQRAGSRSGTPPPKWAQRFSTIAPRRGGGGAARAPDSCDHTRRRHTRGDHKDLDASDASSGSGVDGRRAPGLGALYSPVADGAAAADSHCRSARNAEEPDAGAARRDPETDHRRRRGRRAPMRSARLGWRRGARGARKDDAAAGAVVSSGELDDLARQTKPDEEKEELRGGLPVLKGDDSVIIRIDIQRKLQNAPVDHQRPARTGQFRARCRQHSPALLQPNRHAGTAISPLRRRSRMRRPRIRRNARRS